MTDGATSVRCDASLGALVGVSFIGVLLHVMMDLPTPYGTRFLSPFDWHWYGADWLPIIDVYLLAVLAAGLLAGRRPGGAPRRAAALALALMAANYGLRASMHAAALRQGAEAPGTRLAALCPERPVMERWVGRWPQTNAGDAQDASRGDPPRRLTAAAACPQEVVALPTFISPFSWRLISRLSNTYQLTTIDLLPSWTGASASRPIVTMGYPNQTAPVLAVAARTRTGRVFLNFARLADARVFVESSGTANIRWSDMRFAGGVNAIEQAFLPQDPFGVTIRVAADGRILEERMGR